MFSNALKTASAVLLLTSTLITPALAADYPVYLDGKKRTQSVTAEKDQSKSVNQQSVFYQVAYPKEWKALGLDAPICNPCDHGQDGVQWTDFHDHLMMRGDLPLRHVFNIGPAYTGNAEIDAKIVNAYAEQLPVRSAVKANQLLTQKLPTGQPIAEMTDFGFYFNAVLAD